VTSHGEILLLDFGAVVSKSLFETTAAIEKTFKLNPATLDWSGPLPGKQDSLWQTMLAGEITEREYWYKRARQLSTMVGEPLSIQDIISRSRPRIDDICRSQAIAAMHTTKTAGATVAVLTNELLLFYGSARVNESSVLSSFDHIFDASYTKILKPDPRAYAMVTAALDVKPSQIVFVDDQIANIEGARLAGYRAIHLDLNRPQAAFDAALDSLGLRSQQH